MNFTLATVSDSRKLGKLTKKKLFFNNYNSTEHLSVIHNLKLDNNLSHLVYHLKDEYCISTTALGERFKIPYSSLINLFYKDNNEILFIENLNPETDKLVMEELSKKTKTTIEKKCLCNEEFIKIFNAFDSQILSLNFINEEEEHRQSEHTSQKRFNEISQSCVIKSFTLSFDNKLMTVYNSSKINISNEDEHYLMGVIERLYICLEK